MPARAAHAKLNLFLHVLAREASGYHRIETLFCRIALADEVSVERSPTRGIQLDIDGEVPGPVEDNLVYRAAAAFHGRIGNTPHVKIQLTKRIPIGAGLGGGSSDAAATLRALNSLYDDPLPADELIAIASTIGSDVAFFASGSDLALAWGRGSRMISLPALPQRPILLAVPPLAMSTEEAYRLIAREREGNPPPAARVLDPNRLATWDNIAGLAVNDFQDLLLRRVPDLAPVRDAMLEAGARIAMLSGSGSAFYSVFDDDADRAQAAAGIRDRFQHFRLIETASTAPGQR